MKVLNSQETLVVSGGVAAPFIAGVVVGGYTVDALHHGVCLDITNAFLSISKTVLGFCAQKTAATYNNLFHSPKEPVTTFTPINTEVTTIA